MENEVNKVSQTTGSSEPLRRVSGKVWKAAKKPTHRSMMPKTLRRSYEQRIREAREHKAFKQIEKGMRDEKEAKRQAHVAKIVERRKKREEAERLATQQEKMSLRKRMRVKRKELKNRAHAKH
ncbi:hypothetical protein IW140_003125 [Coemansia sp. RSA 1813]|nr:hypothetical protein EV178_003031 [Coemansia sp. RSA 1646]KAJ1768622.1 hypothetical protein LPJ74_004731 [Coemansia sp. RSA 1843]KAJ2089491.1 hypothetical protein IW138_003380 [Coemansia sp. RSA 986]KAJ2214539.1 hypothetical protein EV179_002944 [Coemansia sp. RSA 487]KAJ2569422.1 hypothetical protein IW140_003125 [Coemansia sp. RSA 1813]